uniref:hypothetical protein n=1 Tax=Trichocoleus desertorum TaxID=1481672 RepID=UPI0025B5D53F|nr:hypothetical protein [Trichocoleus desertorum]
MVQVVIVVDVEVSASSQQVTSSSVIEQMVAALRQAILTEVIGASTTQSSQSSASKSTASAIAQHHIQVFSVSQILHLNETNQAALFRGGGSQGSDPVLLCPLTLNLPDTFAWLAQTIYQQCRDVDALRRLVEQQFACAIGSGFYWLPIVYTKKGPLYGEVITLGENQESKNQVLKLPDADLSQFSYCQPLHLSDEWRQPLYKLGYRLLRSLSAPPATYLLQFGFQGQTICFDRLWPFPAAPAIASLGVQTPDLFACHWRCLTDQPILDLVVAAMALGQTDRPGV